MSAVLVQAGTQIDYTPAGAVIAGDIVNIGDATNNLAGIVNADGDANRLNSVCIGGVYKVPKLAALALTAAAPVGWDISAGEAVTAVDVNSDFDLGKVIYAAAAADTHVHVLINGQSI